MQLIWELGQLRGVWGNQGFGFRGLGFSWALLLALGVIDDDPSISRSRTRRVRYPGVPRAVKP